MEFIDRPNRNSKKIFINHNYELAEYLDIENGNHISFVKYLLNHKDIKNIFSGPNFLTVTKFENNLLNYFQKVCFVNAFANFSRSIKSAFD